LLENHVCIDATAVVIAAGGDGVRIGGSKASRMLGGQRLIDHALAWALRHSDRVALAVRPGDGDWGSGLPLLVDRHDGIGPVTALANAFQFAHDQRRPAVLMIGCDMPFLPENLLERLQAAFPGHGAAMPVSGGRRHPMAALWVPDAPAVEAYIASRGQSLWRFAQTVGMAEVAWDEAPDPFQNINRPTDLAAAELRLRTALP
jgi:molybdopterin-guanine dinucleotide biosynthesis protein A